jgi:hypothetical protein
MVHGLDDLKRINDKACADAAKDFKIHVAKDCDGNVVHAFATASFALPSDHWIYGEPVEPQPLGDRDSEASHELRLKIREALKYTIQVCTNRGKDSDFDPDAMWMSLESVLFRRDVLGVFDGEPR